MSIPSNCNTVRTNKMFPTFSAISFHPRYDPSGPPVSPQPSQPVNIVRSVSQQIPEQQLKPSSFESDTTTTLEGDLDKQLDILENAARRRRSSLFTASQSTRQPVIWKGILDQKDDTVGRALSRKVKHRTANIFLPKSICFSRLTHQNR